MLLNAKCTQNQANSCSSQNTSHNKNGNQGGVLASDTTLYFKGSQVRIPVGAQSFQTDVQ